MQGNRDGDGRWLKGGPSPNPGGLSRRQMTVMRLIEGLTPKAVRALGDLMDDPDAHVRLGAIKEILNRVAPPPKAPAVAVNVAVNSAEAHLAAIAAMAQKRVAARAAAEANAAGVDAVPVSATVVSLDQAQAA